MNTETRSQIAGRLRRLLGGGEIPAIARQLDVEELSLRMSLDELSPHPTIEVLVAVVRHYAVDPAYLLTGTYDAATHRKVIDAEADVIAESVRAYAQLKSATAPVSRPTPEPSTLRAIPTSRI